MRTIRLRDESGFFPAILVFTAGFVLVVALLVFELLRLAASSDGSGSICTRAIGVLILSPFPAMLIARLEYRIWARSRNDGLYDER